MDKKGREKESQSYGLDAYIDYGNYFILSKAPNCKSPGNRT